MLLKNVRVLFVMLGIFCFTVGSINAEHPGAQPTKKVAGIISMEELVEAIEVYVNQDMELRGGYFMVYDQKVKKPLALKLDRVHKEIGTIGNNIYFACAYFKTTEGKLYDLDFFMKGTEKNNLRMTEITVHKEAGKPRYNWYEEKGIWKKNKVSDVKKEAPKPENTEQPTGH